MSVAKLPGLLKENEGMVDSPMGRTSIARVIEGRAMHGTESCRDQSILGEAFREGDLSQTTAPARVFTFSFRRPKHSHAVFAVQSQNDLGPTTRREDWSNHSEETIRPVWSNDSWQSTKVLEGNCGVIA